MGWDEMGGPISGFFFDFGFFILLGRGGLRYEEERELVLLLLFLSQFFFCVDSRFFGAGIGNYYFAEGEDLRISRASHSAE